MEQLDQQEFEVMSTNSTTNTDILMNPSSSRSNASTFSRHHAGKAKFYFFKVLQIIHFLIVMGFIWAGFVEFINNPPFFDAYGDAIVVSKYLPEGIFVNDPRINQSGLLRLMDLPILIMLFSYAGVTTWLKYQGLAWLLTASICVSFLFFWIVNFWARKQFDWRYYSTRMSGLEFQVSALALSCTNILMVLFYKRRRLPFKFRSSLPLKRMGLVHLVFNFAAIFLIMYTSMLMWFTKMYISWACFKDETELLGICQITNQVQCYPCSQCTVEGIKKCYKTQAGDHQFSCNTRYPDSAKNGAFCIFNYNMGAVQFLTIVAYIGGLCVFLSNVIRLLGHYILRVFFIFYEWLLKTCNKTSETLKRHREKLEQTKLLIERRRSADRHILSDSLSPTNQGSLNGSICPPDEDVIRDLEDAMRPVSPTMYDYDSGDGNFLNASLG